MNSASTAPDVAAADDTYNLEVMQRAAVAARAAAEEELRQLREELAAFRPAEEYDAYGQQLEAEQQAVRRPRPFRWPPARQPDRSDANMKNMEWPLMSVHENRTLLVAAGAGLQ